MLSLLLIFFLSVSSYLFAKYYTAWANCLTKSLAERLSESLQPFDHILRWVHSAILTTGKEKGGNMSNKGGRMQFHGTYYSVATSLETHFEICGQISGWLVPSRDEIAPQLLNGGHGSSEETKWKWDCWSVSAEKDPFSVPKDKTIYTNKYAQ